MGIGIVESLHIAGVVRLRLLEPGTGRVVLERTAHNLVTDAGLALFAARLVDSSADDGCLLVIALGTGNAAPAAGNTALGTEYARVARYAATRTGAAITISAFFAAAASDCHIREVGVFGGAADAAVAGSGTLFARTLADADNAAGEYDVSVDWTFTLARG